QVPLVTLLEIARHMGVAMPERVAADGSVSGALAYTQNDGLAGGIAIRDASLKWPDAHPLQAPVASIAISKGAVRMEPTPVDFGDTQSAEIEGTYTLTEPRALDVKVTTRGLNVADTRSFALVTIPVLEHISQGSWRGWTRYSEGEWSGEFELRD